MQSLSRTNPLLICTMMFAMAAISGCALGRQTDGPSKEERAKLVDQVAWLLVDNYVLEEVAGRVSDRLRADLKSGVFDAIDTYEAFASLLTATMQEVSGDMHLAVKTVDARGGARPMRQRMNPGGPNQQAQRRNYGFHKVEALQGNVGHLELRMFGPAQYASEKLFASMRLLDSVDALIIDLRHNNGGTPGLGQMLAAYFFDDPTLLSQMFFRPRNRTSQIWSANYVPSRSLEEVDLYILTSRNTFSAAESFTRSLQVLGRATIIGEETLGGLNIGRPVPLGPRMSIFVPLGTALDPVSGESWQGNGIKPDVIVKADRALETAHRMALEKLIPNAEGQQRTALEYAIESLDLAAKAAVVTPDAYPGLVGVFGDSRVSLEAGVLTYHRHGYMSAQLIQIDKNIYRVEGIDSQRIRFEYESGTRATSLTRSNQSGMTTTSRRTSR